VVKGGDDVKCSEEDKLKQEDKLSLRIADCTALTS